MLNIKGERELAYVVKIDRIEPIIGSDNCESAIVGGWHIMVRKETFKEGDLAVYFEIDSKLPETDTYAFLAPKHYKVKTQKYTFGGRGNFISQGLLMHFNDFKDELKKYRYYDENDLCFYEIEEGTFLTKELGVTYSVADDNKRKNTVSKYTRMKQRNSKLFAKYKFLNKMYKSNFGKKLLFLFLGNRQDAKASFWPSWVVKTDEERVQNLPQLFPPDDTEWFVTEKIDGTSTTFTMKKGKRNKYEFYVCSRNVCFDKPEKECFYETNVYTEMAEKYNAEEVLHDLLYNKYVDLDFVTIQGETYGKGVQNRDYHMNDIDFKAFNLILGHKDGYTKRLNPAEMTNILTEYNIPCVPILDEHFKLPQTIDDMVKYAEGDSVVDGDYREGVVLRTYDGVNSFKAVSNVYLTSKYGNN
jgi:hypothetical protein